MCGIIGMASEDAFSAASLLERLKRLEYRGYDSYGYASPAEGRKDVGLISVTDADRALLMHRAIAHTRWATHGGVTRTNAHPHRVGDVTIVHNGIIENWQELRSSLERQGAAFTSETDSEVIAHLVQRLRAQGMPMEAVLAELPRRLRGTFATLLMVDGDERLFAAKRDSPLALGICDGNMVVASDIYAFSDITDKAIFFENDECAIITPTAFQFYKDGAPIARSPETFAWTTAAAGMEEHGHYMHKEIFEQPQACTRLLESLSATQRDPFARLVAMMRGAERIVFTAAGTAYHAALLGAGLLHAHGIPAQALIASEFENFIVADGKTLVIAVSQSGETMDVIEALKGASRRGATVASVVNVPYSTIERMSSCSLQLLAGQEVAVASTKAFTNMVVLLAALARAVAGDSVTAIQESLGRLPEGISLLLSREESIASVAHRLASHHDLYIIGRKDGYPVAREIALKIKEVSYLHAEGMMAGELKHGTIALIEEGTPVLSLIFDDDPRMRSSTQEVRARGAQTIVIGTADGSDIALPTEDETEFAILAAIVGQLLAYHIASDLGRPIDKPRNLAKSVTVT